jgi:N-acyl-D-amino-acid deacylase
MPAELLISDARIVDGCGNPWFRGDLLVRGERIAQIAPPGSLARATAAERVDAGGRVLCPGFIDILSHAILPLMRDGRCLSKIAQGVTTEIMGESWTPGPIGGQNQPRPFPPYVPAEWGERQQEWTRFGDWLRALQARGVSPNIGAFLGGGTLRQVACGMRGGPATPDELALMRRVADEAMADGAFGVSYALIYPPESYVATDELVAVCRAVAARGGVYATHLRSEGDGLLEALDEALEIGRAAGLPVHIYHLKALRPANWPKMERAIARIHAARAAGQDVTADMYPYLAGGTGLDALLPDWAAEDGQLYARLEEPAFRARVRAQLASDQPGVDLLLPPELVTPLQFFQPANQGYAGRSLAEIAAERGQDWIDCVFELLRSEQQRILTLFFGMDEANLREQLRQPWLMVATDAGGVDPDWAADYGPTHPRAYGSYPRVLGRYVRDERLLTLEEAIRKMTSLPANRLGLHERGRIAPGAYADLVLLDPAQVRDRATFSEPHQLAEGVSDVWVNGVRVLRAGEHTGATPGKILP